MWTQNTVTWALEILDQETYNEQYFYSNKTSKLVFFRLEQVVKVHQGTVDSYLENIILKSIDNTATEQCRMEIQEKAELINDVAYEMEDK